MRQPSETDQAAELEARAMDKPPPPPTAGAFLSPVGVNAATPTVAGYDRNTQFVSLELASAKVEAVEAELKKQRAQHLQDLSTIDDKYKAAEAKVRAVCEQHTAQCV